LIYFLLFPFAILAPHTCALLSLMDKLSIQSHVNLKSYRRDIITSAVHVALNNQHNDVYDIVKTSANCAK